MNTFVLNNIATILGLISGIIIARYLGPGDRGNLSLIIISISFFSLLSDFINGGNEIQVGGNNSLQFPILIQSFFSCILITLALYFVLFFISSNFENHFSDILDSIIIFLFSAIFLFQAINESTKRILLARQDFFFLNRIQLISSLIYAIITVFIIGYLGKGLLHVLVIILINNIFISSSYLYRLLGKLKIIESIEYNMSLLKNSIFIGSRSVFVSIPTIFLLSSDLWLIQILTNNVNVGIYQIAVSISALILVPSRILSNIIRAKAVSENNGIERALVISKLFFFLSLGLTIIFFFTGKVLIELFYGFEYVSSFWPAFILCVSHVIYGTSNILGGIILAKNKYPPFIIFGLNISFLTNLILNFYLIPHYGINGAAYSSLIAYFIMNCFYSYKFITFSKISFKDFFTVKFEIFLNLKKQIMTKM
jgi:O-antigen/teichoic acid export membrane protein